MKKKTNKTKDPDRKTIRNLRVDLTSEELLESGKQQADKSIQLRQVEERKKRVNDDIKSEMTALESELSQLASLISSGYKYEDVNCLEFFDDPKPGKKTIIRTDTMAVVSVENMTPMDLQRDLDLEDGAEVDAEMGDE